MGINMINFQPRPGHGDQVLFAHDRATGRIRLNRPEVINALNRDMVLAITGQLNDWATDDSVANVVIDGAGDRGLCAGGDIKALHSAIVTGDREPLGFWADEYAMNAALANYRKPTVALMDGIVMGGGVGISAYASMRVLTDRSAVAMPETGIGFFPDVGVRFLLARAPGELGTHLALTGTTVGAGDAIAAGLGDVVADASEIADLLEHLAEGGSLKVRTGHVPDAPSAQSPWLADCYAGDDAGAIVAALAAHSDPAAHRAADEIRQRSPLAVAVTLAGLRRAATMTLVEVLDSDAHLAEHFAGSPDFVEGVRAQLIDKDRQPRWQHASVDDVTPDEVEAFFRVPVRI
ncbi:3-hydroxyisobutyryl-CoA hydrolase [Propionibacteriaceae bacterium Y2011]|uniref:3-hydroxyisobutyryl-CoA hydrolase n=1 Tax=Microlunatus sp. Y2014 TaxID=3418488 RepID=UPI003B458DDA